MKLLFNPNTNVGVYVKHMRKTIFPIDNTKKGNDFQMCAIFRSAFLPLSLKGFDAQAVCMQNRLFSKI